METLAGSAATLVYDGVGQASVKQFTVSGLVEDSLYAFKVKKCRYTLKFSFLMKQLKTNRCAIPSFYRYCSHETRNNVFFSLHPRYSTLT